MYTYRLTLSLHDALPISNRWLLAGDLQVVHHRLDVQPGAADEQRLAAPRLDPCDGLPGHPLVVHDRAVLPRVEQVDGVVRHVGLLEIGRASCRERVVSTCRSRWSPYH